MDMYAPIMTMQILSGLRESILKDFKPWLWETFLYIPFKNLSKKYLRIKKYLGFKKSYKHTAFYYNKHILAPFYITLPTLISFRFKF